MVKKRGYTPTQIYDSHHLSRRSFVDKWKTERGWSHLKVTSVRRRFYYLRKQDLPAKAYKELSPSQFAVELDRYYKKEQTLPKGIYYEYVMFFDYGGKSYGKNRRLALEIRILTKERISLDRAEVRMLNAMDGYNLGAPHFKTRWKSGFRGRAKIYKGETSRLTVIDKASRRIMEPYAKYISRTQSYLKKREKDRQTKLKESMNSALNRRR